MIKPQELRIGNLIMHNDVEVKVWGIERGFIKYKEVGENSPIVYGEPNRTFTGIPITKEWLLKNCAYGRDYGKTEELHQFDFTYKDGTPLVTYWSKELKKLLYGRNLDQEIGFIHELQNIFYWNENRKEELTIKE